MSVPDVFATVRLPACVVLGLVVSVPLAAQPAGGTAATPAVASRALTIEGLQQPAKALRFLNFDGQDLTATLQPRGEAGRVQVALTQPNQFVVKPREIATVAIQDDGKTVLPGGVVVPLIAQPDESTPARSAWFRLTVAASPTPAPWDPRSGDYRTRVTFGLRRPPQLPEGAALERPIIVKLGYEGLTAEEVPALAIEASGLEHEKTVELAFRPLTPEPKLLVRSTISDADLLLRALGRLEVRPQQKSLLGFGLETVTVVIENVLPHGQPRAVERGTRVTLQLDGGARLDASELVIAAGESSTAGRIRSSGLGTVTLTATAGGASGQASLEQTFPIGPLIAALLGGALGGYARRFVKGARKARMRRNVIEGTIVGLVGFVAGVLGVGYLSLPAAVAATEAGAFLVGVATGFIGVSVIESLGRKNAAAAR